MADMRGHALLLVYMMTVSTINAITRKPHIILILADDLGWNDVSFHGSNQIQTPNIDSLAYSGIILNNYYVSPLCTPTRAALMSGKYPIHTGLQVSVINAGEPSGLPLNVSIMPNWFKELGYRTHMIGKWHLGSHRSEYTPTYRGFESFFGYYSGKGDFYYHLNENMKGYIGYDFRSNTSLDYTVIGQYSTTLFKNRALDIIHQHNLNESLFLYLAHQAAHSGNTRRRNPLQAPTFYKQRFPYIENKERKEYAGMVAALDKSVGDVVEALQRRGMYDNSIILFTTDNGGASNGMDSNAASNFPLRGMKATLWEGGIRATGFIHSPLLQSSPYTSKNLIHVCDWLPTLYAAASGNPEDLGQLDGYNMWAMLSNDGDPVREEILHNLAPDNSGAIRLGDYKLIAGDIDHMMDGWYPPYQFKEDSIKLHFTNPEAKNAVPYTHIYNCNQTLHTISSVVVNCGTKPSAANTNCNPREKPCLYNIPSDPCEYNNIADDNEDIVSILLERLSYYNSTMVPPLNQPIDPKSNPILHNGAWVPWLD